MSAAETATRIWVYPVNRNLNHEEEAQVKRELQAFIAQWAAHGKPLQASAQILWHSVIVLVVDQRVEPASGCSIDSSVHFIKELGKKYDFNAFDRTKVPVLQNEELSFLSISEVQPIKEAQVINYAVSNEEEYKEKFIIPFEESAWANMAVDTGFNLSL